VFPLIVTVVSTVLLELVAYFVLKDPNAIGLWAIFVFIAEIIYFSFRDGVRGGIIATTVTILYYLYIISNRNYTGQQLVTGVETTAVLGALYYIISGVIGYLKQKIDDLIEREADEKRRLQNIIQQLPVGVIITDSKGKVTEANKQMENILGIKIPIGIVVGKEMLLNSIYKNENRATVPSDGPLYKAITTGKPIEGSEFEVDRKDGKKVFVKVNAAPVKNKKGKVIAASSIMTDITNQKEMEMRKDDFINMASHELKTPLTSIKLYLDSLGYKFNGGDKEAKQTIKRVQYQTARLQELVDELLDVSKLQTGKLSFNKEKFRIDELVDDAIKDIQPGLNGKKIFYSSKPRVKIFADKFRIYQVVTNLLTNADKYSPGTDRINVSLKKVKNKAVIGVEDFGIGIDKEQQLKIFERLYQVTDSATAQTYPGFGMGLYIAKEIVKRHQGDIWVESNKGKGSKFYFSLPVNK
jgi:PAS domain S-box-containing protein